MEVHELFHALIRPDGDDIIEVYMDGKSLGYVCDMCISGELRLYADDQTPMRVSDVFHRLAMYDGDFEVTFKGRLVSFDAKRCRLVVGE